MADERNELRHINWHELFAFTHIFKSFKLAIHPSKLALAVAMIVLTYLAGLGLDCIWGLLDHRTMPGEVQIYVSTQGEPSSANVNAFEASVADWKKMRPTRAEETYGDVKRRGLTPVMPNPGPLYDAFASNKINVSTGGESPKSGASVRTWLSATEDEQKNQAKLFTKTLNDTYTSLKEQIDNGSYKLREGQSKQQAREQLDQDYNEVWPKFTEAKRQDNERLQAIGGLGLFDTFTSFEWDQLSQAISAAARGNFFGRGLESQVMDGRPITRADAGFLAFVANMARGFQWLLTQHTLYAIIYLLIALAFWALLGGAIHRIAALQAAREEKISILQALRFSLSKWPSFFTAPLIPLGVVGVLGVLIIAGSLFANIPYVGPGIFGIFLFVLALLLGLAAAFVLIGLMGGFGLMYPTIAVEGSDSFDAISRSFAYMYARPWRAILYAVVALVYGAVCYLFVRFFAFLALLATYLFMRWGVWTGGQSLSASDRVPVMWRQPTWDALYGNFPWEAMDTPEKIGAIFIWLWVALVAAVVGGFLLSYFCSSMTIIYYLLRRKVDATDLDDVYVQEATELPAEPAAEAPAAPAAPASAAAAQEAPAAPQAEKPAEQNPPPANP